jgi:Glycosyl transferases group 1
VQDGVTNVLFTATSCPRSEQDWQSIFIRRIADALAETEGLRLRCWAPEGPRDSRIESALTASDARFLHRLTTRGGIAHLLRNRPALAVASGLELVTRMHCAFRRQHDWAHVYHLNWLQSALGHAGKRKSLLVTVLGTDMALLRVPGMRHLLRNALRRTRVVLCPNAEWMVPLLQQALGDICEDIVFVPFGVDDMWFRIQRKPSLAPRHWVTVLRVTRAKIGPLFEWTQHMDVSQHRFHLFGPLQERLEIPPWIQYHGPATPENLASQWFPEASGLISLSQHDEGRPQVMLEAMAAKLPVIASSIRAHTDLITDGENGLLCSTQNHFTQALNLLSDETRAAQITTNAWRIVRASYGTWHDCAARYEQLYSRLTRAG